MKIIETGRIRLGAAVLLAGLAVAACGGGDGDGGTSPTQPASTEAPVTTETPVASEAPSETGAPAVEEAGPPTGEEMLVGMVNTEGTPGLDFPDIRRFAAGAFDYVNEHGGFGNRPVRLVTCIAKGSPETSQSCAQELVGKGVELVLLGLDLFPDYKTYEAAGIPVIGALPILPIDYTANALFMTGGNATVTAVMAAVAKEYIGASKVGILSADNAGANSTVSSLEAALAAVGIEFETVKGGDNETDAGYQGLMREVARGNPDLIVSLYSDAGCIGTMRGRAALGITIPVITTNICADDDVIAQVGDDADGWMFVGVPADVESPERAVLRRVIAPVLGVAEDEVDTTGLGLGSLGSLLVLSLRMHAAQMVEEGLEVTGPSLYEYLQGDHGLVLFGGETPLECGALEKYPAVCTFGLPVAEYKGDGLVAPVEGLELVDAKAYLP